MGLTLLVRLQDAFEKLSLALGNRAADEIIMAAAAIRPLITEIENSENWHSDETTKAMLGDLAVLIENTRISVNMLADTNRQRADILTNIGSYAPLPVMRERRI